MKNYESQFKQVLLEEARQSGQFMAKAWSGNIVTTLLRRGHYTGFLSVPITLDDRTLLAPRIVLELFRDENEEEVVRSFRAGVREELSKPKRFRWEEVEA